MDHKLAESLQLADKYMLNEMSEAERSQFEEHMFDCPLCADQVRQDFTVVENLKQVLREEQAAPSTAAAPVPRAGWRDWLRLPSLVPTLAALALVGVIAVQHSGSEGNAQALVFPAASALAPVSRGGGPESAPVLVNRRNPLFLVSFNVDNPRVDSYVCEFADGSGSKILSLNSPAQTTASFNLPVLLPAKSFPAGNYQMMLRPASEPDRITTYPFSIEDSK